MNFHQFNMGTERVNPNPENTNKSVRFLIRKIALLKSVRKHLKLVGCFPMELRNMPSWCAKIPVQRIHIGFVFVILILNLVSTFWFYIREIRQLTLIDFCESVFWASRSVLSLILYSMLIWFKDDLVKFFDDLDDIVDSREYLK